MARRAREIGIRIVLGAQTGSVVWLVMREVLTLVFTGVLIGLPAAYLSTARTACAQTEFPSDESRSSLGIGWQKSPTVAWTARR